MATSCALLYRGAREISRGWYKGGVTDKVKKRSWIQPSDAARYFDVSPSTIRRWISDGKLRAAKLPTGHLRILARDVIKFLLKQGRPITGQLDYLSSKHVLIIDPDRPAANSMAVALRGTSGCKVTVAQTASQAKGLLNGSRPDLVLLGVRQPPSIASASTASDLLILADGTDDASAKDARKYEVAFQLSEILQTPVDENVLASRVAHVLLG